MPNLDNIFNKFFPQSQTTKKGIFLLRMAWGVEILVAIIGLFIGIIIIRGAQGSADAADLLAKNISLNDLTIGLIFIIVAVVELTKIPLATAVYYSVRLFWKVVFLIALVLVNISTFETIITGFERINRERTKVVDKYIVEYNSVKTQIQNINENVEVNDANEEIELLIKRRSDVNGQIGEINVNTQKQIQGIKESSVNQQSIENLQNEIEALDKKIENLQNLNTDLSSKKDGNIIFTNKKTIDKDIEVNNSRIEKYEQDRERKSNKLDALIQSSNKDNEGQISIINVENKNQLQVLLDEKKGIEEEIKILEEKKRTFQLDEKEKAKKVIGLKDKKNELIAKIDELAPDNQVFRVATWLKGWFIIDYNKEIKEINEQIFVLEKQKVESITEKGWFYKITSIFNKNSNLDIEAIDSQILRLQKEIKDFERKIKRDVNKIDESVYADLPRGALTAAFWLWFGVLGFIISITGTMLAFASLVLLDPRLHKIRNKPGANWRGVANRLSLMFVLINKFVWGKIKRLKDPIIKIKEIEVEKIVEKETIIEKNIGEKIVYEKIEVPKETIRKEIVYVPLPTNNEDLLKKGPFNAPDYDKNKKK